MHGCFRAHQVHDQIRGKPSEPYAQQLPLGWVIIREVCLDGMHTPTSNVDMKNKNISILKKTPVGVFIPYDQKMHISERVDNHS